MNDDKQTDAVPPFASVRGYAALLGVWKADAEVIQRDMLGSPVWLNSASKAEVVRRKANLEMLKYCIACLSREVEEHRRATVRHNRKLSDARLETKTEN